MPIYAELVKTPKGLALAKQAFEKAKPGYHPITTASVQDMLAKAEAKVEPCSTDEKQPSMARLYSSGVTARPPIRSHLPPHAGRWRNRQ
ncbi:hypothetical protein G6F54_013600 [Rhizopus delemar]|nr:hypothetical protein G6F54_013600 [Rhizopus delemar]